MNYGPLLTIYIVHYRRLPQLKNTIKHIQKNTSVEYLIKIFNNGYIDDDVSFYLEELKKKFNYNIIYSSENVGASKARSILAENLSTPYVLSLDDDMYLQPGWDRPIFEKFQENSKIGAMGFALTEDQGKTWFTCGKKISIKKNILKIQRPIIHLDNTPDYIAMDDICSGGILYRTQLKEIIKWDPYYFVGFEDLQKGINLFRSDYRCYVSTKSRIFHDKVSKKLSYKEYNKSRRNYKTIRKSYLYFSKKNGLRFDLKKHIFYKYFCLLPSSFIRPVVFSWLFIKDKIIR
ncbi:MAG: hypothetical protein COT24_03255 [Candidatus Kerfeldbacteria bacterium CG08_land_8_20_14_0_20_40_16]|uniref:Glycosyltransferase 2-like domain-containing protein n=1 Tax=Candidatus Kerfeldbacteria bacterium CG08_land_8_20_14_0_20_40_16 TaxID=2014244 RepID=A0A2H0YVG5_9BACT|nr:MAG: hypothetical protein COT24_03255 [Candidatus Kerfeldbacteria bacterium CG08_land_8_20_14_0_20_40_16]